MDATVDDFFDEINKISSKEESTKEGTSKEGNVNDDIAWQECYDELTGYSYFWNTETDEVTWVPPKLYKPAENAPKKTTTSKSTVERERRKSETKAELYVPPSATQTQYSSSDVKPELKAKVYSIQEEIKKPEEKHENSNRGINIISNIMIRSEVKRKMPPVKKVTFKSPDQDSDDEKIELITEYGGDSDSDDLAPPKDVPEDKLNISKEEITELKKPPSPLNKKADSDNEDEDDDDEYDLLAKIQQRAKELKTLGGELPSSVKNIIKETIASPKLEKATSGFSLVAGYNSESSESESESMEHVKLKSLPPPTSSLFPIPPPTTAVETSHSTLFPIAEPINLKDFIGSESPPKDNIKESNDITESNDFDNKAFQRKRRIGISLVNNAKRSKEEDNLTESEFKGLGFKSDNSDITCEKNGTTHVYPGFQKGGVKFVKSDVLNPEEPPDEKKGQLVRKIVDEESKLNKKETEDDYTVLREKLLFLGEGRDAVLPVQAMFIQAETLFVAMKEGGLKLSYLYKWLKEMCSELIKLEKQAAPDGWLLQWDRSHKRYYYQNTTSGVSQWKYPEPDVTRCDDAMDISTTPPPPPDNTKYEEPDLPPSSSSSPIMFGPQLPPEPPLPPSPPKIRSPTPPPPPVISTSIDVLQPILPDVPLPPLPQQVRLSARPPPPPAGLPTRNGQPRPPGIELLADSLNKPKDPGVVPSDTLSTALDSFYSEIAEVTENSKSLSPNPPPPTENLAEYGTDNAQPHPDLVKKKKKKVKLAQGLTMKKKGVSELVEKWKNVQKTYKD